jgi:hypothetical protein
MVAGYRMLSAHLKQQQPALNGASQDGLLSQQRLLAA